MEKIYVSKFRVFGRVISFANVIHVTDKSFLHKKGLECSGRDLRVGFELVVQCFGWALSGRGKDLKV